MRMLLVLLLVLVLTPGYTLFAADEPADADKAAIEKTIVSYVTAFNAGNAPAVASHWTEQGEMVTPVGEKWQGHKQLAEQFTAYFAKAKGAKLELVDTQVEVQSPSTAVETGIARVTVPEQEPEETEYKVVHVKTADGWKMDSVREKEVDPPPPSHYEKLKELEWMVGQWKDNDENAQVETTCRWASNQNFLVQNFKVVVEDRVDFEGTQIIGWDPSANTIRSWLFDSDGGFGAGRWSGGNGRWTVQSLSVLPDGRRGASTNVYELVDDKTLRYQSIGRQVDGELMPSVGPVTIVRATNE